MKAEIYYTVKFMQYRRYSSSTINSYVKQIDSFLDYFKVNPRVISESQVQNYFYKKVFSEKISTSSQNLMINAIKLFYKNIIKVPLSEEVFIRPRKSNYLPTVLSKSEVKKIIDSISNLKHKAIISTIYGCGLRISEVRNLQIRDIDSKRMVIYIRQAKGNKDRTLPLSQKLLKLLREYWKKFRPEYYLFEGPSKEMYSETSISNILRKAVENNNIYKQVKVHTLRHSFATHLMEAGINIRFIQALLGHKSIKTTEIYTHVSVQNMQELHAPIDDII